MGPAPSLPQPVNRSFSTPTRIHSICLRFFSNSLASSSISLARPSKGGDGIHTFHAQHEQKVSLSTKKNFQVEINSERGREVPSSRWSDGGLGSRPASSSSGRSSPFFNRHLRRSSAQEEGRVSDKLPHHDHAIIRKIAGGAGIAVGLTLAADQSDEKWKKIKKNMRWRRGRACKGSAVHIDLGPHHFHDRL